MTDLAKVYLLAADTIRRNGHTKGDYYSLPESAVGILRGRCESPVCAAGALSVVVCGDPIPYFDGEFDLVIRDFASRTLGDYSGDVVIAVANWNDTPERTPADVIAAFEQAAKEAA